MRNTPSSTGTLLRGGVLVTKCHIVTASHCFVGEKLSSLRVLVVISNFNNEAEVIDVEKEKLDGDDHDITVLKLKKEVIFHLARTIPVYDQFYDKDDVQLEIIGWDKTERGSPVLYSYNGVQKLIDVNEAQCKKSCSRINTQARVYNYRDFIKDMIYV
ncbi:hypothetical protein TSAR_002108 [Trichomalopsis sarcophagae]|uniref:Peptidase S1 domain-containing protein n=1 Tax=Trichomalopsis sarcophagae TaxID=543379 RepID=A0A232EYL4_9HYME|nr:hypothetical protein TSAR_002108 [Trichomalopsis sarcophagae]